jgi:hypothetical protein
MAIIPGWSAIAAAGFRVSEQPAVILAVWRVRALSFAKAVVSS